MVTSSARSSNVCKLHFLSHVIEYIIYRFIFLSLTVALFDTRCSIVYKFTFLSRTTDSFNILHFCRTMLKFLWNLHFYRYAGCCIDCAFTLQFQYFFVYLHFCRTMLNFLWNLYFCLWLLHWLCIYIFAVILAVAVALFVHLHFCRLFCIAYKFSFLLFAVDLHFAACFCVAYSFFLFCKFAFCRLLLHCLRIYIFVAHYCILFEQTIDYITEVTRQEYVRTT